MCQMLHSFFLKAEVSTQEGKIWFPAGERTEVPRVQCGDSPAPALLLPAWQEHLHPRGRELAKTAK